MSAAARAAPSASALSPAASLPAAAPGRRDRVLRLAALLAIVALAAHLRYSGLDWGHRHPMHIDEQAFVASAVAMLDAGDLDHRYHKYPGLFFYVLAACIAPLGPDGWHTNDAYVVARGVVATFGVLNVALLAFAATRWIGPQAGLVAALLAAVSPVDVATSHQVRPDVLLQLLGLLGVAALRGVGPRLRGDAAMGLAIGLASAVKYTGVLLVPSYLLARLLARGPRLRGLLAAGAVAVGTVLVCTPTAVLDPGAYRRGPPQHLHQYYPARVTGEMVLGHAAFFVRSGVDALGTVGAAAFVAGSVLLLRRSWREWGPPLLHPAVNLAVMSTGSLVFPRYILPAMGIVHLAAAAPFQRLAGRWPSCLAAAALLAYTVSGPLARSQHLVYLASHESAQDKALDWILANVEAGSRVLETRDGADPGGDPGVIIGLPPDRYEVLFRYQGHDRKNLIPLLAPHADLVVMYPGRGWRALRTVYVGRNAVGADEVVLKVPVSPPHYDPVDLRGARVSASENHGGLALVHDGDTATSWRTSHPLRGGEWLQVDLDRPLPLGRVELVVGKPPERHDPEIALLTTEDGREYAEVPSVSARAPLRDQAVGGRELGLERLLKPRPVRGVRVVQRGRRTDRWVIAELRLWARRRGADGPPQFRDIDPPSR